MSTIRRGYVVAKNMGGGGGGIMSTYKNQRRGEVIVHIKPCSVEPKNMHKMCTSHFQSSVCLRTV